MDHKNANIELSDADMERKLQVVELEEIRREAYKSLRIYKEKTRAYDRLHDLVPLVKALQWIITGNVNPSSNKPRTVRTHDLYVLYRLMTRSIFIYYTYNAM